ncbi:MAG: FAD-linked oxidase C-terminal domain-containing protein [Armatimonadota bacterium]|nr:FAD-linked oxidase C-terminal domain-containing protein [Armatimonadota bacterium]
MTALARLESELARIVGADAVITDPVQLLAYDCDAYTIEKSVPTVVVLPQTTEQVSEIVKLANREGLPVVPRGAGTGLSGGALAVRGGIVIATSRMNKILWIDTRNRRLRAQAGVVNYQLSKAVQHENLHFAPDPSSQGACTIGGNVAENSGGPHTLKYGVTVNHITGLQVVLPDGEIVEIGGAEDEPLGYDLLGLLIGSEGTLAIVTEVTARLTPNPQTTRTLLAVFETLEDASQTVSDIIADGIVPAALELMDALALQAVEAAFKYGFPLDAEAVLLIELDGLEAGIDSEVARVLAICQRNHAREVRRATTAQERAKLWAARKKAIGALGRLAPSNVTQDGVIPRSKLPKVLREAAQIAAKYQLRLANVFHAGDGNLHPVLLFDDSDPEQVARVVAAGDEILALCLREGGSLSGEHGIGVEKCAMMHQMFTAHDLDTMRRVKSVFNPDDRLNPEKMFPDTRYCYESKRALRRAATGL